MSLPRLLSAFALLLGVDKNGKPFGSEMFAAAKEGTISEVTCMWPRPGGTKPVDKVSRIAKIGDQLCGVGYYKE